MYKDVCVRVFSSISHFYISLQRSSLFISLRYITNEIDRKPKKACWHQMAANMQKHLCQQASDKKYSAVVVVVLFYLQRYRENIH